MLYVTHDQVEAMTLGDRVAVLNLGRLQQIAAPREVYEQPANAFVAGFIGNPPMNLFSTQVTVRGDGAVLRLGGQTVPVQAPADLRAADVRTAGVRPEAIGLAADAAGETAVRAVVEHLESLGHETLAHVRIPGETGETEVRLVARLEGMHGFARGETVQLRIDPQRVYLFGADEVRMAGGGEPAG
jgi:ABC-type sugar transport system ATPase subunit